MAEVGDVQTRGAPVQKNNRGATDPNADQLCSIDTTANPLVPIISAVVALRGSIRNVAVAASRFQPGQSPQNSAEICAKARRIAANCEESPSNARTTLATATGTKRRVERAENILRLWQARERHSRVIVATFGSSITLKSRLTI
jgi:hypothetical protein